MIREVAPRPVAELLSGLCGEGAPGNARFTAKRCAGRGVVGGGCRITTWAKAADAGGSKRKWVCSAPVSGIATAAPGSRTRPAESANPAWKAAARATGPGLYTTELQGRGPQLI